MFPFVSLPPSQSITLRRWHRRRSRRNHDDAGGDDDEVRTSKLLQHSISRATTSSSKQNLQHHIIFYVTLALLFTVSQGRTAFEKMTDLDYVGETYYTIRNLSLYECQGWCREEPECSAASFSFAVNPNSSPPRQETVCLLQNGTQATNPSAKPLRALNQYYMVKMSVRSDKVCKRPWNFERVPNAMIQGHDRALIFTSTKEACLAACLNEKNFICRSAEYNYVTLQCRLSDYDRRSISDNFKSIQLIEAQGVDYFENLCLSSNGACEKTRRYAPPSFGLPEQKVALHVGVHFYIDKELMANSESACERACTFETEFLCRSYLYLGAPTGSDYNCKMYHLDHWTLPDGISSFLNSQTPLVGDGSRLGKYYENRCERSADFANGQGGTSGTSPQLGGGGFPSSIPGVISGGGSNGNGASNTGGNGGSNGVNIGGGSNGGTIGSGSNGGNVAGGINGGNTGSSSNGGSIGGGSNGGNIGGASNGGNNGGSSNGGTIGGGSNGGNIGGGSNGGNIGGGSNGGTIGGGSNGGIGVGGSNGGNIGGSNNGGGSGSGNGNIINGQINGQGGANGGNGIGNGQNGGSNGNGGSSSQNDGSGGFSPSLGGQIGVGPGGSFNPGSGFNPGGNPTSGSFGPGGSINNPGGSNSGNNPFGPGGGINNGGSGINTGGSGINNGGNGNNNGVNGNNNGGNGINNGGTAIFGPGGSTSINNGGGNRPGIFGSGDNTVGGGGINVVGGGSGGASVNPDFGDPDVNCDNQGTCYDVTVHCKDTRIVVNVGTNRPFSGRIYALGRSETCNVDVISSDSFRLDLTMAGQDCNTQSVNGIYTNTVVVQRHSVVMTKTDKIYKVRCTYDTSSRNVTFGMMPIRDPDMISITSAPEAPAPRISILDSTGKEVETVRIGDQLKFKIEIPDKTPYGIFARSCLAMAKDSRSTFAIIDENGCPIDPTIFPRFTPDGAALVSQYEAFRFTESYGVIFQCNVKYCLGPCPPTNCQYGREAFDSWGRRKRDTREKREIGDGYDGHDLGEAQMQLSHEIIVLDYGDEKTSPFDDLEENPAEKRRDQHDNATDYHATPLDWKSQHINEQSYDSSEPGSVNSIECPTSRNSVLALAVTCSLLVILYVCTVMCMCYRKAVLCSDDDDDRCSTSTTKSTMLPEAILRGLPSPVVTRGGGGGYIPNSRDYMR